MERFGGGTVGGVSRVGGVEGLESSALFTADEGDEGFVESGWGDASVAYEGS